MKHFKTPAAGLGAALAVAMLAAPAQPAVAQDMLCCGVFVRDAGKWRGLVQECRSTMEEMPPEQLESVCEQLRKDGKECPEADELCLCDEELIKRLIGRNRGLLAARAAHNKDLTKAKDARWDARDRLWGQGEGLKFEGGSIAGFGKGVLDTLMIAGGGSGVGKAVQKVDEVRGWASQAKAIVDDPASLEQWSAYGQKVLGKKADEVLAQRTGEAYAAARRRFQQSGNVYTAQAEYRRRMGNYGDLKQFRQAGKTITDFMSAIETLGDLWEKTDALAKDVQDYSDAFRDSTSLQAEMDKIDDESLKISARLKRLQAACRKAGGASLRQWLAAYQGSASRVDAPAEDHLEREDPPRIAQAGSPGDARAQAARNAKILAQARRAVDVLARVEERFKAANRRFGPAIIVPVSPWLAGDAQKAEPQRMLPIMVMLFEGDLGQFRNELNSLAAYARQAKAAVEAIPRDSDN